MAEIMRRCVNHARVPELCDGRPSGQLTNVQASDADVVVVQDVGGHTLDPRVGRCQEEDSPINI